MSFPVETFFIWLRLVWVIVFGAVAGCTSTAERRAAPLPAERLTAATYTLSALVGETAADFIHPSPWLTVSDGSSAPITVHDLNAGFKKGVTQPSIPQACQPRFEGERVGIRFELDDRAIEASSWQVPRPDVLVQDGIIVGFADARTPLRLKYSGTREENSRQTLPVDGGGGAILSALVAETTRRDLIIRKVCFWRAVREPKAAAGEVTDGVLALVFFGPLAAPLWAYKGVYEVTHRTGQAAAPKDEAWEAFAHKFPIGSELIEKPELLLAPYPNKWRMIEQPDLDMRFIVIEPGRPREGDGDRLFDRENIIVALKGPRVEWSGWLEPELCDLLTGTGECKNKRVRLSR